MRLEGAAARRYVELVNKASAQLAPSGCVNPYTGEVLRDDPARGIFMTGTTKLIELDELGGIDIEGPVKSFGELAVSRGSISAADKAEIRAVLDLVPKNPNDELEEKP